MPGLSDPAETALLKLILQRVDWTNFATAAGVNTLYISLHTADPTDGGSQTSSETTYTDYARVAVARSAAGWDVVGDTGSNVDPVIFPKCGVLGSPQQLTHFGVGTAASGAGSLVGVGPASLLVSTNIQPQFDAGALQAVAA